MGGEALGPVEALCPSVGENYGSEAGVGGRVGGGGGGGAAPPGPSTFIEAREGDGIGVSLRGNWKWGITFEI